MKILIATNNSHKIQEINKIAGEWVIPEKLEKIQFVLPQKLNINLNPNEIYHTFEENSKLKAKEFFNAAKIPTIADDSGLEIEVLNNAPGVHSARFAGDLDVPRIAQDKANRDKVLNLLKNETNRKAKFRTVLAFFDGNAVKYFVGECKGQIIDEERGENGFGYDSIFIPDGFDKTFAEMNDNEKNKISHRYFAVRAFCEMLNNNT